MNIQETIDSIYRIPIILEHLEKPTNATRDFIDYYGIDIEEYRPLKNLLWYHSNIIKSGFTPNYSLLRKGLREYSDKYLSDIFIKLFMYSKKWKVLDYGSGDGQLSEYFLRDNPDSIVTKLDRDIENTSTQLKIDFELNQEWYIEYINHFDCVILSEVLHCKDIEGQLYLLNSSIKVLTKGGFIVIIENEDYSMAYRISKIKRTDYQIFDMSILNRFNNLLLLRKLKINSHKIYLYEKI